MTTPGNAAGTPGEHRVDLVMEGGGVKGIALVGAFSILEQRGFQPQNLAGTSAGAIVTTLIAAGYNASELKRIVESLDFRQFQDTAWEDRIPLVGKALSILLDQGIYEGHAFAKFMEERLLAKGVRTFRDLIHPLYAHQPRYRYKVNMIASDVTERRLLVLPQDAASLGIVPDDLSVTLAVRMSMSIPIFFEPVRIRNPQTGREHLIVDGGMLSNYPVWLFDSAGIPEWPTFGLQLVEDQPRTDLGKRLPPPQTGRNPIENVIDYVRSLIFTMLEAHDRLYIEKANFARTIPIPTLGVGTTEFDLSREQTTALYESGRRATEEFLTRWNFPAYVEEFRKGKEHSRRRDIAEELRGVVA